MAPCSLYNVERLKIWNNDDLTKKKIFKVFQITLLGGDSKDIDGRIELYEELIISQNIIDDNNTSLRIILIIPVTSATAEGSFLKL